MQTINKTSFENYLSTLKICFSSGVTYLTDEIGEVCVVNVQDSTHEIEDTIYIDGYEFRLTDNQKQRLYEMAYDEGEEYIRQANQYILDCRDEDNLRDNLNRYYR